MLLQKRFEEPPASQGGRTSSLSQAFRRTPARTCETGCLVSKGLGIVSAWIGTQESLSCCSRTMRVKRHCRVLIGNTLGSSERQLRESPSYRYLHSFPLDGVGRCYLNNLSIPTLPTATPPTQLVHFNDHLKLPPPGESCVCGARPFGRAPGRSWFLRPCTTSMC